MLDFNQLMAQLESVSQASFTEEEEWHEKLHAALDSIDAVARDHTAFLAKVQRSAGWVLWPVATALEDLNQVRMVAPFTTPGTIIGVDGSQIMPSHHEVHTCYLLNVGYAVVTYGEKYPPVLESRPTLYHRPEDLYPLVDRRRLHIDELYVSMERNLLELETLSRLAQEHAARALTTVVLLDGSLIPWSVEKLTDRYRQHFLDKIQAELRQLQKMRVPLIGYLSSSRATDVINMLRVFICPYEISKCSEHCQNLTEEEFPCSSIWPLADRQLFLGKLRKQERSAIFLSDAAVTKNWSDDQRICFSYMHVGAEVARLEFPRWLVSNPDLLEEAFAAVFSQVQKGMGYPIVLSEAHHLAVIKGTERERFFQLLAARMIDLGLKKIHTSPKEARKRLGFV